MGTIKLRRGSGSPAGSLAQYEVAMDVAARNLYTSSDGSDAVIIGQDVEYFLKNNTISGITNASTSYSEVAKFQSLNFSTSYNTTGIELTRDLSSDGAVSGRDSRGVEQLFSIYSDAVNTNGSAQKIYTGTISGQSGSNDGSSPHWLAAATLDDGISTFNVNTLWDGTKDEFNIYPSTTIHDNSLIDGTSGGLTDTILQLTTDAGGWNRAQILLTDPDDDAISLVGASLGTEYRLGIEFDPNNTNGRTGASSSAGDYAVIFAKDYSDASAIKITQKVWGANDGYELTVYDDYNGGVPDPNSFGWKGYGYKPYITNVEHFTVNAKDSNTTVAEALKVSNTAADFSVPVQLPNLTTTERNALTGAKGMTIYNTTEDRIEYYDGAWKYISGTAV